MLRVCDDTIVPKYENGFWKWDQENEKFQFIKEKVGLPNWAVPTPKIKYGVKFKSYMDQIEEIIFRSKFARSNLTHDADVITLQDIKNVVIFMAPSDAATPMIIELFYTKTLDNFLNALITYFEYFLKVVELLLIWRDENDRDREDDRTRIKIGKMVSAYIGQYRVLLAREYSEIIMGTDELKPFYHMAVTGLRSKAIRDILINETFLSFCTQIVWITMHRRAYTLIDCEINRLFRSGHFNIAEKQLPNVIKFTKMEEQILYGKNDRRTNYRAQRSPVIEEILHVDAKNMDLLWIGERKYRGTDKRIYEIEQEFAVPDSQLAFVNVTHGLMSHPKKLFNTMLVLNWDAVRSCMYTVAYDPYKYKSQPTLELPDKDEFEKKYEREEALFRIIRTGPDPDYITRQRKLWKNRDQLIGQTNYMRIEDFNVVMKCQRELENAKRGIFINRHDIIANYLSRKARLQKKKREPRLARRLDALSTISRIRLLYDGK